MHHVQLGISLASPGGQVICSSIAWYSRMKLTGPSQDLAQGGLPSQKSHLMQSTQLHKCGIYRLCMALEKSQESLLANPFIPTQEALGV